MWHVRRTFVIKVLPLSRVIVPQMSTEHSETINSVISRTCLGWQWIHNQPPSRLADTISIFTDHCVTSLCKHVRLCLYVTSTMLVNNWPPATYFGPCGNTIVLKQGWETQAEQHRWTECVTLIISLRCDSGSRPAMGRILIFCVLEQRSARDRVIFLWVALSVEWGLKYRGNTLSDLRGIFPQWFFLNYSNIRSPIYFIFILILGVFLRKSFIILKTIHLHCKLTKNLKFLTYSSTMKLFLWVDPRCVSTIILAHGSCDAYFLPIVSNAATSMEKAKKLLLPLLSKEEEAS